MPVTDSARRARFVTHLAKAAITVSALALTVAGVLLFRALADIYMDTSTFEGLANIAFAFPILGFILALTARQLGRGIPEVNAFISIAMLLAGVGAFLIDLPLLASLLTPDLPVRVLAN